MRRPFLLILGFLILVGLISVAYPPDRPADFIEPGTSSGPAFVVQIIRPRASLPLAGLIPPQLLGADAQLKFDSNSVGATIGRVGPQRIELASQNWDLTLALDADGSVNVETQVVFEIMFRESLRKVRCRPANPVVGSMKTLALADADELSGNFSIELGPCIDAVTGKSLGWPTQPFILHGSFDRLPLSGELE